MEFQCLPHLHISTILYKYKVISWEAYEYDVKNAVVTCTCNKQCIEYKNYHNPYQTVNTSKIIILQPRLLLSPTNMPRWIDICCLSGAHNGLLQTVKQLNNTYTWCVSSHTPVYKSVLLCCSTGTRWCTSSTWPKSGDRRSVCHTALVTQW